MSLGNILGSLVTTILGILASAGLVYVNQMQANPDPLIYGLAGVLATICALLRDPAFVKALVDRLVSWITPKAPPTTCVLLLGGLLLAGTARADSAPTGPLGFQVGTISGRAVNLEFGLGFSGYAYDFGTRSVTRDVQFTGLAELSLGDFPLALLGGAGFQTGENQGLALQIGPEYRPLNAALLFTAVPVGSTQSYGIAAGYVLRF